MEPEIHQKLECSVYNKVSDKNFWNVVKFHLDSSDSKAYSLGVAFVISFILSVIGLILFMIREMAEVIVSFKTYKITFEKLLELLIIISTLLNMVLMFCNKGVLP